MAATTEAATVPVHVTVPAEAPANVHVAVPAEAPANVPVEAPATEAVKVEGEAVKTSDAEAGASVAEEGNQELRSSFKEESNFVADLKESEKKALQELRVRVEEALKNNEFVEPPPAPPKSEERRKSTEGEKTEGVKEVVEVEEEKKTITETEVKAEAGDASKDKTPVEETKSTPAAPVTETPPPVETPAGAQAEVPATETAAEVTEAAPPAPPEDIYLWGVPLAPSKGDERTDVVLLKFLRARDFKVSDAFTMLKNTVLWRKKFGVDGILEEDLGHDWDGVAYMHGYDKEGHPVCYNVYGVFQDNELYQKTFGDEAKREKFLRWRVQLLEKGIQEQLSFSPGGVSSMVQITDLKNSASTLGKKDLKQAANQILTLLQDNYPEFVAKKIFVNASWWYLAYYTMVSHFVSPRTSSKFVAARPTKVSETLFKYFSPEYVPVQYGGLSRVNDPDFSAAEGGVSEVTLKSGKQVIEIPATEVGSALLWEVTVVGWDVSYGAQFVPSAETSYTVILHKTKKFSPSEEPVRHSFKIGEPGKVVLTIENNSSKRKRILYRSKVIST